MGYGSGMRLAPFACLAGLASSAFTFGCGGGSTQAAPPPKPPAAEATPTKPDAKKTDVEQAHREFKEACHKQTKGAEEYCDCAWSQLKKTLGDDLAGKDDPKLAPQVRENVARECRAKAPEPMVKDGYLEGCTGGRAEMQDYCSCTWAEFRKRYSVADMGDESIVKGEGFSTARKQVVKACGAKMPEAVAKDDFMKGCVTDATQTDFCACAWKETRKLGSPAEIEAGTVDRQKLVTTIDAACRKLAKPAAAPPPAKK